MDLSNKGKKKYLVKKEKVSEQYRLYGLYVRHCFNKDIGFMNFTSFMAMKNILEGK